MINFWMNQNRYHLKSFKGNDFIILSIDRSSSFVDYILCYVDVRINKDLLNKGFKI